MPQFSCSRFSPLQYLLIILHSKKGLRVEECITMVGYKVLIAGFMLLKACQATAWSTVMRRSLATSPRLLQSDTGTTGLAPSNGSKEDPSPSQRHEACQAAANAEPFTTRQFVDARFYYEVVSLHQIKLCAQVPQTNLSLFLL